MSDLLLVGLGNPGAEYAATRHNLGRQCLEELASRLRAPLGRRRWRSRVGSADVDGRRLWLVEPETFMNLSGRAVAAAMRDLGPDTELWAVYDELDLPLCRLRIRMGGSAAGHNGVKSLIASLGTSEFVRFRVGIGRPSAGPAPIDYVVGRFSRAETASLPSIVASVADALELAIREGVKSAMDRYNQPGSLGCPETP